MTQVAPDSTTLANLGRALMSFTATSLFVRRSNACVVCISEVRVCARHMKAFRVLYLNNNAKSATADGSRSSDVVSFRNHLERAAGAAKCVLYVFCLCISWHLLVPFDTQTWWY